jgi:hypothetical protein
MALILPPIYDNVQPADIAQPAFCSATQADSHIYTGNMKG